MGEYTDYPADYAEVSSFQSGQQSPAAYATTTLVGNSGPRDTHRFNMFYTTEACPPNSSSAVAVPGQSNNNYNRSMHSESYCTNNNKVNIVENRMANTMMPNMFNQQLHHQQHHNGAKSGSNKRNRLKLMNPQNFKMNVGSQGDQLYVKVGDMNSIGQPPKTAQHTPQSQNGSVSWNSLNFNIYENQMHNGATTNDLDKEFIYSGNRSVMSYMSSKDFPENV